MTGSSNAVMCKNTAKHSHRNLAIPLVASLDMSLSNSCGVVLALCWLQPSSLVCSAQGASALKTRLTTMRTPTCLLYPALLSSNSNTARYQRCKQARWFTQCLCQNSLPGLYHLVGARAAWAGRYRVNSPGQDICKQLNYHLYALAWPGGKHVNRCHCFTTSIDPL
jgi:hypothetical protein